VITTYQLKSKSRRPGRFIKPVGRFAFFALLPAGLIAHVPDQHLDVTIFMLAVTVLGLWVACHPDVEVQNLH
jgi:hypothetical protein